MEKYIADDYDYYRPSSSSSNTLPMPKSSIRQRLINSVKSPFSRRRTKSSIEIQSNDSKFKLFWDKNLSMYILVRIFQIGIIFRV